MDTNSPEPNPPEEQSDCSCCCEDVDSSPCSCCSCDCDIECSTCRDSPNIEHTNSKSNIKILKKLHFLEKLSRTCETSSNHVLLNNFKDFNKNKLKLRSINTKSTSSNDSSSKDSDDDLYFNLNAPNNKPNRPSLHSKQLEQELLEIDNLLSDTNLDHSSNTKYNSSDNSTYLTSDSNLHSFISNETIPNLKSLNYPNSRLGTINSPNGKFLNSWPSGFNAPKYHFDDSDYEDLDKLYSMLISLDLYSYMYVVENVLDQRMKQELSIVNSLS